MTVIERLTRLDTCAVRDALDRLGLPRVAAGIRPLTGPHRIAGRGVTMKLVAVVSQSAAIWAATRVSPHG